MRQFLLKRPESVAELITEILILKKMSNVKSAHESQILQQNNIFPLFTFFSESGIISAMSSEEWSVSSGSFQMSV